MPESQSCQSETPIWPSIGCLMPMVQSQVIEEQLDKALRRLLKQDDGDSEPGNATKDG